MKAIILVGGKATRLLPLTINTPKSLVPVVNIPMLEHLVRHLSEHNIKEIVLAQGHLSKPIEDYFGDGGKFGVKIYHSYEDTPLGSAGAAKNAEKYIDGTFLVLNSDIISDMDFTAMLRIHRTNRSRATIATTPVDNPTAYGLVETDLTGRVTRFLEKPKPEEVSTDMINAGAWFVEADVLAMIPPHTSYSFERNVFPTILASGQHMFAYSSPGYWIDMGTPEKYLQVHRDLLSGRCRRFRFPASGIVAGDGTNVQPSTTIAGTVITGRKCSIGERARIEGPVVMGGSCVIEDDCVIEGSVLWENVHLERGASVSGSIVADNCTLHTGCIVQSAVLANNVTVGPGVTVAPGTRAQPGTTL